MKKVFLFILVGLLFNLTCYSQTLSGRVLEVGTKKPIAYVNIGILGKNIGTVSDSLGYFAVKYNESNKNDTLKFSCIGYESIILKPAYLIGKLNDEVMMDKMIYQLQEVVVKPLNKSRIKILGKTGYSRIMAIGKKCTQPGSEIGVLFRNKQSMNIQKVNLYCSSDCKEEVLFRINISDEKEGRPDQSILKKPIIFKYRFKKGDNFFDLSEYNIIVSKNFVLTYELLSLPKGSYGPQFGLSILGTKSLWRYTSQAKWGKFPASISFSISVIKLN
jgi:hypothetical protein